MKRIIVSTKRKGQVSSGDGHIYSVKTTKSSKFNKIIKMFFSKLDSGWTEKVSGKLAAKYEDHGNGVTITIQGTKIELDYSDASDLYLLLDQVEKHAEWKHVIKESK
jgi:hypothetical protein